MAATHVTRSAPRRLPARRSESGKLAVVTSYFNPCDYAAPKRNFRRFAAGLAEQGVPLFAVELAFDDRPFFLDAEEAVLYLRGGDVMWQKERLLNLAIERVPPAFEKIAWVDADLLFTNPGWAHDAAALLDELPVVQLFDHALMLDARGRLLREWPGVAWTAERCRTDALSFNGCHPGFAWAAQRSLLERHGLLDDQILGGADALMVVAMLGQWSHEHLRRQPASSRDTWLRWALPFHHDMRGHLGATPGTVMHLWHGSTANRQYVTRQSRLVAADFDPRVDLMLADNGVWRWATDKPELHRAVRQYFLDRREDERAACELV